MAAKRRLRRLEDVGLTSRVVNVKELARESEEKEHGAIITPAHFQVGLSHPLWADSTDSHKACLVALPGGE